MTEDMPGDDIWTRMQRRKEWITKRISELRKELKVIEVYERRGQARAAAIRSGEDNGNG